MLAILASRFDLGAARLAERWRDHDARLLTAEGLSRRGWIHASGSPDRSFAVLGEETVPVRAIRGVLTRLAAITESELPHVVPEEREYVATEMTAFLLAWLTSLPCPVVNRPSPLNLSGPGWRQERWIREAARLGLATLPVRRVAHRFARGEAASEGSQDGADPLPLCVAVVGERCLGEHGEDELDEDVAERTRLLARAAGVQHMTATFVRGREKVRFAGAMPLADTTRPDVADALLELLLEEAP